MFTKLQDFSQPPVEQLARLLLRHASRDPRLLGRSSVFEETDTGDHEEQLSDVGVCLAPAAHCSRESTETSQQIEALLAIAVACADEAAAAKRSAHWAIGIAAAFALLGSIAGTSTVWDYIVTGNAKLQTTALMQGSGAHLDPIPSPPLPSEEQVGAQVKVTSAPDSVATSQPLPPSAAPISPERAATIDTPTPAALPQPAPRARPSIWHVGHRLVNRHQRPTPPATPSPSVLTFETYSGVAG